MSAEATPARQHSLAWIVGVLVTFVPAATLSGVMLLLVGAFTAQRALLIGGLFALVAAPRLRVPCIERWPVKGRAMLAAILLLALVVRWPASLCLEGGQDQGVYVAMAAHFVETGNLGVVDDLRAELRDPASVERYDANNTGSGIYQPGVYTNPSTPGRYVFQFYAVHPLWMAVFGGMLGMEHAAVSQIFFALASLLFAALLAERLTGDWRAGIAYAAILAVLPLHVFFSKFPISEMPTLTFALMGWFALSCYQETASHRPRPLWLIAGALCFLSLFLTRISGFIYLPVIFIGALLTHLFVDDALARRQWAMCWLALVAGYALSVAYGFAYSYPYARDIYLMGFGDYIYANARWLVAIAAVAATVPFALTRTAPGRMRAREALRSSWNAQPWIRGLLLSFVAIGLVRISILAWTDHYQGHPWYDLRWHASHGGADAWRQGSIYVFATQLSPFIAVLLPLAVARPGASATRVLLVAMVLATIAYTAMIQWFVPYQYYYARYQLSELIPYALLIVVASGYDWWQQLRMRKTLVTALALSGVWFAWYAWPLVGFREADGAYDSLARISNRLDSNDVLLFDQNSTPVPHGIVTPLRFFFHKKVYTFRDQAQLPDIVQDIFRAGFGDIYLVSSPSAPAPTGFELVEDQVFRQTVLAHTVEIPRESMSGAFLLAFYRFNAEAFAATAIRSSDGLSLGVLRPNCCRGVYADNGWTDGNATVRDLPVPDGKWHELLLTVHGYRREYERAGVKVLVNGREIPSKGFRDNTFAFDLGEIDAPGKMTLDIRSQTFVPKNEGGLDPRELGIDIKSIRVR